MKKTVAVVVAVSFLLAGCGRPMDYNGKHYPTHGILNESSSKSKHMCYEISWGNVFWSVVLVETIVFPVYFVGFSLFNPVRPKKGPDDQCTFDS